MKGAAVEVKIWGLLLQTQTRNGELDFLQHCHTLRM